MSLEQFSILTKLGKSPKLKFNVRVGDGSYSSVYKVKRLEDSLEYALKKVKIQNLSDREKENALNEVRILASIKNPFVAGYKQAFFDEPSSSLW
jgi:NIMA (never in mitosis gene a)-related kinase